VGESIEEERHISKDRLRAKLQRDCGERVLQAMLDPATVEIVLNPDGKVWQERLGEPMAPIGVLNDYRAIGILKTVAAYHDTTITNLRPHLECEWPLDGSRFAGQIPPIVSQVSFAIRKKAVALYTLDDYVKHQILEAQQADALREAVHGHRNILVIGGTGSGKTTFINALIAEMVKFNSVERFITMEDTAELQCAAVNKVQYYTSLDVGLTSLVKLSLRMRPDRILVGEVRDGSALDLLDAWNTGHPGGAATLHANNALSGLTRLKSLITRNPAAPSEIEPLIAEAVNVVVSISRTAERGRRVQEVLAVDGFEAGRYITRQL